MRIKKSQLKAVIKEVLKENYEEKFRAKLKKFGVKSQADLKGDQKKKFFDELDAETDAKEETD